MVLLVNGGGGGMEVVAHIEKKDWLHHNLVGTLIDISNFDNVQKTSVLLEGGVTRLNYIGDDLVLIKIHLRFTFMMKIN